MTALERYKNNVNKIKSSNKLSEFRRRVLIEFEIAELEKAQLFKLDDERADALVAMYNDAVLSSVKTWDVWDSLVLTGKMTLFEAVVAELLNFEKNVRWYNEQRARVNCTHVIMIGYNIHIYCSEEFRERVKKWLVKKGLIDPSLKKEYDEAFFEK